MRHLPRSLCEFDIDKYLNPFVPSSPIHRFPRPIAHFLGHRSQPRGHICQPLTWWWSFVGAFCSIALIEGVYRSSSALQSLHPPVVIGSYGAAAILEFNIIESPLSQPRNLVLSQVFSAAIGVGITKLFELLPPVRFADLSWLAGALAVGVSSAFMSITKTVHPPAGATALLAATSPDITKLGWWLLPLALIASLLMLGSALVINNIQGRFPTYWWTPEDLRKQSSEGKSDVEKAPERSIARVLTRQGPAAHAPVQQDFDALERKTIAESQDREIRVLDRGVFIPDWLQVTDWEKQVLEMLRIRLLEAKCSEKDSLPDSGSDDVESPKDMRG